MIKILIVDDNSDKIRNIVNVIFQSCDKEQIHIDTASFVNDAKTILSKISVDILILDICLPERPGSDLQQDAGIKLLNHINGSNRYTYPRFVIALSEYKELANEFSIDAGIIHTSIVYDLGSNEWKIRLAECMKTATSILSNNISRRSYDYDVAVICALKEELDIVKMSLDAVKEIKVPDDDYIYYEGSFFKEDRKIRVVMAQSSQMGMVPASTLTTRLIYNFVPRYIVMTGITAGIKGIVNMGDVIAAEYTWDYGAGKDAIVENESVHRNTIQQIQIDTDVSNMVRRVAEDESLLQKVKKEFNGTKPNGELHVVLGPVASGASVIADPQIIKKIQDGQIRDVVGIEMEIFGVYYAARWSVSPKPKYVALKAVCDYANADKDDKYHPYASYTSAKIFVELAKKYFEYDFG